VFVRTKDWVARWNAPGTPGKFQVLLNGKALTETFGTKGAAWGWLSKIGLYGCLHHSGQLVNRNRLFSYADRNGPQATAYRAVVGWWDKLNSRARRWRKARQRTGDSVCHEIILDNRGRLGGKLLKFRQIAPHPGDIRLKLCIAHRPHLAGGDSWGCAFEIADGLYQFLDDREIAGGGGDLRLALRAFTRSFPITIFSLQRIIEANSRRFLRRALCPQIQPFILHVRATAMQVKRRRVRKIGFS
jgi:hypothetical protein